MHIDGNVTRYCTNIDRNPPSTQTPKSLEEGLMLCTRAKAIDEGINAFSVSTVMDKICYVALINRKYFDTMRC
ncbi:hypothetical protein D9M68_848650 [compost metagenome]